MAELIFRSELEEEVWALHKMGYSNYQIAKRVFGDSAKRYKVSRIIKKIRERIEKLAELAAEEEWCAREDVQDASQHLAAPLPEDTPLRLEDFAAWERLGSTEKRVLEALILLGEASPSEIIHCLRDIGDIRGWSYTRNAVWCALQRLVKRGYVMKTGKGRYRVVPGLLNELMSVYVENFMVGGEYVWSKRKTGVPLPLLLAFERAVSMGKTGEIEKIELSYRIEDPRLKRRWRSLGLMHIFIYGDRVIDLKIDVGFHETGCRVSLPEAKKPHMKGLEALMLLIDMCVHVLKRYGMMRIGGFARAPWCRCG